MQAACLSYLHLPPSVQTFQSLPANLMFFQLLTCSSSPLCNYEPMCWCFKCFVLKRVTSKFTKKPKQTNTNQKRQILPQILSNANYRNLSSPAEASVSRGFGSYQRLKLWKYILRMVYKTGDVAGTCWRWMLRVCKRKLQDFPVLFLPQRPEHCIVGRSSFLNHLLSRYMCCFHRVGSRSYSYFFFQLNLQKGNKYSGFALKSFREELLGCTSWLAMKVQLCARVSARWCLCLSGCSPTLCPQHKRGSGSAWKLIPVTTFIREYYLILHSPLAWESWRNFFSPF